MGRDLHRDVKENIEGKFSACYITGQFGMGLSDGKWLAVYHQETDVAKTPPPPPAAKAKLAQRRHRRLRKRWHFRRYR